MVIKITIAFLCGLLYGLCANAYEINIYDSVSDKDKVVIEYIRDNGKEVKMLVLKKDLEKRYEEIEEWLMNIR